MSKLDFDGAARSEEMFVRRKCFEKKGKEELALALAYSMLGPDWRPPPIVINGKSYPSLAQAWLHQQASDLHLPRRDGQR